MASVGFFRRPSTLPVHPLASPSTPGNRCMAGDRSGGPRGVRGLCGLWARRPWRAIRPRESDTQTRPGRSWSRLRGVRPVGLRRAGCLATTPKPSRPYLNAECHLWSRQQLGGGRGACGNGGGGDLAPEKCHRGHIQKFPDRKKTCLYHRNGSGTVWKGRPGRVDTMCPLSVIKVTTPPRREYIERII